MSAFFDFIPLLFLLVIMFTVLWLFGTAGEKMIGRMRFRTQKKIFHVYAVLLLASSFIYEWMPNESSVDALTTKETDEQLGTFHEDVIEGRVKPLKTWSLPAEENRLILLDETILYGNGDIIVQEKKEQDGMIDIAFYTKIIANGLDVSSDAVAPEAKLDGVSLNLIYRGDLPETRYSLFQKEHVISQFTGEGWSAENIDMAKDKEILFVTVPAGMVVTADNAIFLSK